MSSAPLVSVIVPAYNSAAYITETISSLLEQTYPNIEIIVVNDGSQDKTLDVLKAYQTKIVLIDQLNTGVSGARNTGIRAAKGDFISFCDSDDLWAPQKIHEQLTYLQHHPSVGMVYCDWHVWNPDHDGNFVVPDFFRSTQYGQEIDSSKSGWIYHKLLLDCICLTSTVMLRNDTVNKVGFFNTDLWCGEDYDYWLRVSRITEIHKLKSKLVLYRSLAESITRKPTRVHYEYEVFCNAIAQWGVASPNGETNDSRALKERVAKMRFDFGYHHLNSGDAAIAIKSFADSIIRKPLWHLPWMYLMLALYSRLIRTGASSQLKPIP